MKRILIIILLMFSVCIISCNDSKDNNKDKTEQNNNSNTNTRNTKEKYPYETTQYDVLLDQTWNRSTYYQSAIGTSNTALYNAIKQIMLNTHTVYLSYGEIRYTYLKTDADPNKQGNIITFYSRQSVCGTWDGGVTFNREHVWPKSVSYNINGVLLYSKVGDSDKNAGTDAHHIRPETKSVNSSRNNTPFGESRGYFEPSDEVKGDVARILFYLAVHYDMDLNRTTVCESVDMLLEWNELDPVDEFEKTRNNAVKKLQGNYNPFIDNPWLADAIFG